MRFPWVAAVIAVFAGVACGPQRADSAAVSLDDASRTYVRLVLALGERDSDSLDSYHGPTEWRAQAQAEHASLATVRAGAVALGDSLKTDHGDADDDSAQRRAFLIRQLGAVVSRIDILQGARPSVDEEARMLFGLDFRDVATPAEMAEHGREVHSAAAVRAELDRVLPGLGELAARYAAFDRQFLVPADRLEAVLSRAIDGCRTATRAHVALPDGERVQVDYVRDLPWSAFTRYEGRLVSRIRVNAALPLTVDRVLDLACHEGYPGHHMIATLLDARFGQGRPEFLVQPLFSPQAALHEAGASLAPRLAFPGAARIAFERDELFPLAGLDPSGAARHVAVGRLVDDLHGVEADVVRGYLDGALDFPRAAAALEHDALMPSAEATLKFVNQFRSYAATYTIGRDALAQVVAEDWASYLRAVTDPTQMLPGQGGK